MTMIHKLYSRHYDIAQLFVSPSDTGHDAVARERTYLILTLRAAVQRVHDVTTVYEDGIGLKEIAIP